MSQSCYSCHWLSLSCFGTTLIHCACHQTGQTENFALIIFLPENVQKISFHCSINSAEFEVKTHNMWWLLQKLHFCCCTSMRDQSTSFLCFIALSLERSDDEEKSKFKGNEIKTKKRNYMLTHSLCIGMKRFNGCHFFVI